MRRDENPGETAPTVLILILSALLFLVCFCAGCIPEKTLFEVSQIRQATQEISIDTRALVLETVRTPEIRSAWRADRKAVETAKAPEQFGWIETLLAILSALAGASGTAWGTAGIGLLTATWAMLRKRQETAKKDAALDSVDIAMEKIPEHERERIKDRMRVAALSRGVHAGIKKDLEKRRRKT